MLRLLMGFCVAMLIELSGLFASCLNAQESTPVPSQSIEYFVDIPSAEVPEHTIYIIRFTLQPGSQVQAHSHPGTTILAVEQGALGYTLFKGTAFVIRQEERGAESFSKPESDIVLEAGDTIYYEAEVVHTARNAGYVPVKVHATHILRNGQPLSIPASTPTSAVSHTATPIEVNFS